ncbi:MAG: acireductone synthase [Mycobacterium sp.]
MLDIEGTTSPTASVHDTLFRYTRERIPHWVREHRTGAEKHIFEAARRVAGRPDVSDDEIAEMMREWLDANMKCEPLKTLQGLICCEGFRTGKLRGEFFPDVAPALRRWRATGKRVYVYSSGSERNQRDWFTYAKNERLDHLVDGYFDLVTAGSKRTSAAYRRIIEAIRVAPADTLFLTDSPAELDAATEAGWSVLGVARAGEPGEPVPPHEWITSFDEVEPHPRPVASVRGSHR